jgi:hypothetical protein
MQRRRFRFKLGTLMIVIAVVAVALAVMLPLWNRPPPVDPFSATEMIGVRHNPNKTGIGKPLRRARPSRGRSGLADCKRLSPCCAHPYHAACRVRSFRPPSAEPSRSRFRYLCQNLLLVKRPNEARQSRPALSWLRYNRKADFMPRQRVCRNNSRDLLETR